MSRQIPEPVDIAGRMRRQVQRLTFGPPVEFVYNPLEYAWETHVDYLARYGTGTPEVLLLGMNPGPWGMAQTGVPFGEIHIVRNWLGIRGRIGRPGKEHPRVRVTGFECRRSEISGTRLWGWARDSFGTPRRFFGRFFVTNYCPLMFLDPAGRNLTPDKLPIRQRDPLLSVCDGALRGMVEAIRPRWVIGVGGFAESRARVALTGISIPIGRILHPSPASPIANRDWAGQAVRQLGELGIDVPSGNRKNIVADG